MKPNPLSKTLPLLAALALTIGPTHAQYGNFS